KEKASQFDVISEEIDYLVLLQSQTNLTRSRVKDYISAYNEGRPEEERREYPFNRGSDLEEEFLAELKEYLRLNVGEEEQLRLDSYRRNRFYSLGRTGVKDEDFQLEVRENGDWTSVDGLSDYEFELFADKGILDLNFPDDFFSDLENEGIRASFQYEISGKTYMLGFSVAPNSEQVYLNGESLTKNTDYSIDYETGALILFKELGPDDKLKVDFERARGGLGGFAQFGRTLYGFTTSLESDYGLTVDVSLFQARDSAPAELPPEVATMPNVHSVAGVGARYEENGWNASMKFGGNINRFPFDDNERVHLPNRINDVLSLADSGYENTLFLHDNGFTVRRTDGWESFGTEDGLSGDKVTEGLVMGEELFLSTVSGLTRIDLSGSSPFGRSDNWDGYYESDGLPETELLGLAGDGETVWIGTKNGVIQFEIGSLEEADPWVELDLGELEGAAVNEISYVDEHLWLGTNDGLYLYDLGKEELVSEEPMIGQAVNDTVKTESDLLVGTTEGLTRIGLDGKGEKLLENLRVNSVSTKEGEIWLGTENGFTRLDSPGDYGREKITAILATGSTVWAGSQGRTSGDGGELILYELSEGLTRYSREETRIEAIDENRYRDIDPNSHTNRGLFLSGEVGRTLEVWSREVSLSTDFEYYQPTYLAIGRRERREGLSTGVNMEAELTDNLSVGLGSDYSISSFSTESGDWTITNRVSAYWETFVNTNAEFTWDTGSGGRTGLGLDLGLDRSFWDDNLVAAVNVTANRKVSSGGSKTDSATVSSKLSISPWGSGNIGLNYTYPVGFGPFEKAENEKLSWNFDFTRDFPLNNSYGINVGLDGEGTLDSPLLEGVEASDSQVGLDIEPDELGVQGLNITPGLSLSWKRNGSSNELSGELSGKTSAGGFSSSTSLSRSARFPIDSRLVEFNDKIQGSLSYEFEELTPEVSFQLSRDLLTHPDFGRKSSYSANLGVGTRWQLTPGVTNRIETGVEYKTDSGFFYNLDDSLDWKINSKLSPEFNFGLDYYPGSAELDINTETEFSYPFQDRWGVSFTSGINWGLGDAGEVYNSFYGSAGLRVEF
ncbi:hypothetical protein KGY71_05985, partial [Candidatus Bipolaricaulota bacterium]|nr:hypothetical protein [Candidatus Bipolaricaulota bacterium]